MPRQATSQTAEDTFDPNWFCGTRSVIVTSQLGDLGTVTIQPNGANYKITYSKCPGFEQDLYFNPQTRTLDSDPEDGHEARSISYWKRAGSRRDCIYAMFRFDQDVDDNSRLPFEKGDKGTWGAEDG